ncbi:MAG: hypothetical protein DBX59_11530 [Bacillota bacterium]|nr:MAG: hypothetical protein DBX59_11530 [Bacillota bacterium]
MLKLFRKNEEFNPAESGMTFSLAVLLPSAIMLIVGTVFFACGGTAESDAYVYITSVAAQLSYLALVLFVGRQKGGIKPFRAGKFHVKYLAAGVLLCYGMLFGLGYLNELFIGLLQKAGLSYHPVDVPLSGGGQLALSLVVYGLLPAFCEELLFRGAILRGTDYMKIRQICLINGLAFALFHQNPAQFVYPLITGGVYALVALRSGSALPCVIMHAINNVTIVLLGYFAPQAALYNAATVSSALACFAAALAYLVFFDKKPVYAAEGLGETPLAGKYFFIFAAAGAAMCAVSWIIALFG